MSYKSWIALTLHCVSGSRFTICQSRSQIVALDPDDELRDRQYIRLGWIQPCRNRLRNRVQRTQGLIRFYRNQLSLPRACLDNVLNRGRETK